MARKLIYSREIKIASFVLFVVLLSILAFSFLNVDQLVNETKNLDLNEIRAYISSYGPLAPIVLFFFQALQAVIPILPGSIITIAGGLLLGALEGAIISYFGAVFGSVLVFYISKYFGRGFVEWLFKKEDLGMYDEMFKRNGFTLTLLLRAIPFVDFGFASYLISISSISFREYFFGTAIGLIPTIFIYSYYGSAFLENPIAFSILGIIFLVLFLVTPYFMRRFLKE